MSPTLEAALRSWPFAPGLQVALLLIACFYLCGWLALRRGDARRWPEGGLAAFLGGLITIDLALASPIEPLADLLLQVHMLQHLLLMMVAAPLIWLGAPLFPLLRALPRSVRVRYIAPLFASRPLRDLCRRLTHPLVALPIFITMTWLWHLPLLYELALQSRGWHYIQHGCFFGAALLFWYPVVRPFPSSPRWSLWLLLPCMLVADVSNTILSAVLTFSNHVIYSHYAEVPRLMGISALEDQSAAGVLMWVPGSIAFLAPLFAIGVRLLSGDERGRRSDSWPKASEKVPQVTPRLVTLPVLPGPWPLVARPSSRAASVDLLRLPLLGPFLKWRHARICLQVPLLLLAVVVISDGLYGPQVGGMNLAGVLPWIHWRGVLILGLLAVGNIFCMGCPFLLPRTLARWWLPARWHWPRRLRSKWIAVVLIIAFLWAYEAFSLWDRPRWTAYLALGYFGGALAIDGLFRDASFCKYICPIGQFNFVQSLVSPFAVKARDPEICVSCRTKDCIRGRDGIAGCEMHLFLPAKVGNMDCTTCLDCAHACPHDNVGVIAGFPTAELWKDSRRSGIGRLSRRPDISALVVVLVFGAFANAAGMVGPVIKVQEQIASLAGVPSRVAATTAFYLLALIVFPLSCVGGIAAWSRWWGRLNAGTFEVACRYAVALVPLGFGMWLAHYSYHFFTSYDAVVPVTQRVLGDLGLTSLGPPQWYCDCCRRMADWVLPLELVFLDVGLLLSLYAGYRLAPSLKVLAPWALLMVQLFAVGVWIVFQPMQMRGTM